MPRGPKAAVSYETVSVDFVVNDFCASKERIRNGMYQILDWKSKPRTIWSFFLRLFVGLVFFFHGSFWFCGVIYPHVPISVLQYTACLRTVNSVVVSFQLMVSLWLCFSAGPLTPAQPFVALPLGDSLLKQNHHQWNEGLNFTDSCVPLRSESWHK